MRLRDIEVQSDDFERQARNQTSSLEDVESKYNVAIERGVMLEEEIKIGEQEREQLRIETQRLRDELSDLRIEAEIVQEKLRIAEETIEVNHQRKITSHIASDAIRPRSPVSEASTSATTLSSPTAASTPPHSIADILHPDTTPPSPPLSDAPITTKMVPATPMPRRKNSAAPLDPGTTPRAGMYQRTQRHSRVPSVSGSSRPPSSAASGRATPSSKTTATILRESRPGFGTSSTAGLPRSGSLYQIRGLIGKMQKLEERVQTARSKLPAPTNTPPRASPRGSNASGHGSITMRSGRKRTSQTSAVSSVTGAYESGVSRLSFGVSNSVKEVVPVPSRPESQTSVSSQPGIPRPASRSSNRTPVNHYQSQSISGMESRMQRSRSSMSGHSNGHSHSQSFSQSLRDSDASTNSDGSGVITPMARRFTMDKSGIPGPSAIPRRQSGGRRASAGQDSDVMGPPVVRPRKMSTQAEEESY